MSWATVVDRGPRPMEVLLDMMARHDRQQRVPAVIRVRFPLLGINERVLIMVSGTSR